MTWAGCKLTCHKNNISPITMHNNAAGEAIQMRLVFGGLLLLSATYFQGSAMAGMGKWRDELCCYSLLSISSPRISTYTEATQTLLTYQRSKPSLVELCGGLVQISDSSYAIMSKKASM